LVLTDSGILALSQAVVAGILHDVLDDTDCTEEEVERHFGATVCR
jgi:(p)ppGpp synthase/HD superfamily hydrolase